MSLDKPLDLEFIGKGSYGIIFKQRTKGHITVIKQFRVEQFDDGTTSFDRETKYAKIAHNINNDIFINIFKYKQTDENLAGKLNINVPLINSISLNNYGYIYMEYMNCGDLYEFIKPNNYYNLSGILGCYLNGLNILHNELKIIHGDLTPNNILINYIGPSYRQKIIINDDVYYFDTNGYNYKITDFGLSELISNTKYKNTYMNYLYRDYLLLYFVYFNKKKFYNYNKFIDLIEICIGQINEDIYNGYRKTDEYKMCFIDTFDYKSVCTFMNTCLETDHENTLIYQIPKILFNDFVDILTLI
jgi:serine/threonine protein kinase